MTDRWSDSLDEAKILITTSHGKFLLRVIERALDDVQADTPHLFPYLATYKDDEETVFLEWIGSNYRCNIAIDKNPEECFWITTFAPELDIYQSGHGYIPKGREKELFERLFALLVRVRAGEEIVQ